MANKIEFFKAVDIIDGTQSYFAIHSIDGEDVAYKVIRCKGILKLSDLVRVIVANVKCMCRDSPREPRRRDMVEPVLLYTLVVEGENK
ncbi:hypothetical protein MAR002J2_00060 [Escherichia phage vB_Eco_mar001J1]|uniref:Uncharacterized protein n=1 Tax=Escherichia phage vB_Eco_mar001J1 TaxID=2419760 RepID=A0A3P4A7U8_9CAUD|nr:hypothetical protein HOV61_gp60 [Escherichia phage vB_Eco_mar001J1]YP_009824724.1 hypothetical protein HOV63_gp34 [Escherichia phage vB_Eco_mar001J1]VCU43605.1 hypothetical protein MAR001J1_00034 [Escherichia phage vB_Eco_mar001J1]VCU43709.1 hypothetical protein MAR002J2_00060 [Escherichia phage vB_Eco_mar001J1]